MYDIKLTTRFRKDYKAAMKRGLDISALDDVIRLLAKGQPLPARYKDHPLSGSFSGYRECHLAFDWLLIYQIEEQVLVLTLIRTGTHEELF